MSGSSGLDGAARARRRSGAISPFDHGLLVGDGVFETLRVYDGVPFAWRRHLERLARSAGGLGLDVARVARSCAPRPTRCSRPTASREAGCASPSPAARRRSARSAATRRPTVIVAASEAHAVAGDRVDVVIVPWARNERGAIAGLKTISYAENVRALAYAHEHGAGEAIFPNTRGELCEATGSNVFVVHDGVAAHAARDAGCLLGVTRALVLELARRARHPVEEAALPVDALADADEAFLTSTTPRGAGDRRGRRRARCPSRRARQRPARRRVHRARRARPRPVAAARPRRSVASAEVDDVAARRDARTDVAARASTASTQRADRRRRRRRRAPTSVAVRPSSTRTRAAERRRAAARYSPTTRVEVVERARRARPRNASSSSSRSTASPGLEVARRSRSRRARPGTPCHSTLHARRRPRRASPVAPRRGARRACGRRRRGRSATSARRARRRRASTASAMRERRGHHDEVDAAPARARAAAAPTRAATHPAARVPRAAEPAPARGLVVGHHDEPVGRTRPRLVEQVAVRGIESRRTSERSREVRSAAALGHRP